MIMIKCKGNKPQSRDAVAVNHIVSVWSDYYARSSASFLNIYIKDVNEDTHVYKEFVSSSYNSEIEMLTDANSVMDELLERCAKATLSVNAYGHIYTN